MPNTVYMDFNRALQAATMAAQGAAGILMMYANNRADLIIDHKCRNDLVSQADREAETAIVQILQEQTPAFGIIAEESGGQRHEIATWYIDPLDGTTNFLHGIPHFAVSIGLVAHAGTVLNPGEPALSQDTPIISVVYDPSRHEMFTAVYQDGCWLNGQRIYCTQTDKIADALLATGLPFRDFSFENQYMPTLHSAMHESRGVRRFGSAALDLAWVACGRYDAYWELGLAPWDVAAGTLLVREAGGVVEDLYAQHAWPVTGNLYASNQPLAQEFYAMLKPHLTDAP